MPLILHIETSTLICSVSLAQNGKEILTLEECDIKHVHAERLTLLIQKVLTKANVNFNMLAAIAVSMGPGSFTGLRIGVSTAKGLCYGLKIPLIGINSLESLAALAINNNLVSSNELIVPMIDARRMEVYTAIYDHNLTCRKPTIALVIDEQSFSEVHQILHFIGDGAPKTQVLLKAENFIFHSLQASAAGMINLAFNKLKQSDFEDIAYSEPFYLKDFMVGAK